MLQNRLIRIFSISLLSIVFISCSSSNNSEINLDDIDQLELRQDFEFGGDIKFGYVHDIKIDRYNNLYILDKGKQSILVLNKQRKLVSKIEKDKKEPVEYSRFSEFDVFGDTLYVLNAPQSKLSKYFLNNIDSLKLSSESIYPDRSGLSVQYFKVINYDTLLIGFMRGFTKKNLFEDRAIHLEKYFMSTREYIKILEMKSRDYYRFETNGGFRVGYMPFGNYPIIKTHDNFIYYGYNSEATIDKYNLEGEKIDQIINMNFKPDLISEDEITEVRQKQFDGKLPSQVKDNFPKSFPYYNTFLVDGKGNIWVDSNNNISKDKKLWLVFSPTGKVLYKFRLDKSIRLREVRNDYVYGIKIMSDNRQSIVGYSVEDL